MKELSIEQKAQRYKEALERAKGVIEQNPLMEYLRKGIEYIFPELKESEDERVRKAILTLVRQSSEVLDKQNQNNMLAWLEKQGEFKSNKWTEGDVVRHGGVLALVINGRKAMKSNCEQITIQYPDEWVKAETKERKYFFEELEKQGEQKPQGKSALEAIKEEKFNNANKVEPKDYSSIDPHFFKTTDKVESKFKVGDFIVNDYCMGKVIELTNDAYLLDTGQGIPFSCEHNVHLWTIEDAKDGDVLAFNNDTIVIFKDLYNSSTFHSYCHIEDGIFDISKDETPDWWEGKGFHPATKEQCDTLFAKMKDAGYTFDFEKRKLKKVEDEIEIPFGAKDSELQEVTYYIPKGFHAEIDDDKVVIKKGDKPTAWSEEDELSCFESALFTAFSDAWQSYLLGEEVNVKRWAKEQSKELLEAAKEELKGHNSAWSEEDEKRLKSCLNILRPKTPLGNVETINTKWLKFLKYRIQPIQEWSEEDERAIGIIKMVLEHPYDMEGKWDRKVALDWLKQRIGE